MHNYQRNNEILNELKQKVRKYNKLEDLPAEELVSIGEKLGKLLKEEGLKTTQIRRFLDGVRKLENQFDKDKGISFEKDSVILLRPKLAYAAGRQKNVKPLMEVLDPAITSGSQSFKSFKKLVYLIESIVAYHKFYGGGD